MSEVEAPTFRPPLLELARLFLKLGTVAFGGPAAHIGMMEEEVVRRRGWLTHAEFLDMLGATNLIPGPNSTELALHIGSTRAGWRGMIVAGFCFIVPATLIVGGLAWAYTRFGTLPAASGVLRGVQPVVIAIVAQALLNLARTALRSTGLAALAVAATAAAAAGVNELAILAAAGAGYALFRQAVSLRRRGGAGGLAGALAAAPHLPRWLSRAGATSLLVAGTVAAVPFSLWRLFGVFAKIGSVLFGSGYVLLAFLRADFVQRLGWLNERQLLDAVAVGQITPGPVFTTATFIGYLLGGVSGAAVATTAIFLPAFVFVALSAVLLPRLRRSSIAAAVLDGVNVASLALMAVVTWQLGNAALVGWLSLAICSISVILLLRFRVPSTWLVLGGAAIGLISSLAP